MADTGAPHFIPYVEPTDLVRDYPAADEASAFAVAAGLDAAGGLIAVKSAIFTGTRAQSNVAAGGNFAVNDLEITHEVADPANRLIISAFIGAAGSSSGDGDVGIAVSDGTSLIAVGASEGVRTVLTAGGRVVGFGTGDIGVVTMPSVTFVHTPGAGSKTYTVRAVNPTNDTRTLFINRRESDANSQPSVRAVSSLVIQEVKV